MEVHALTCEDVLASSPKVIPISILVLVPASMEEAILASTPKDILTSTPVVILSLMPGDAPLVVLASTRNGILVSMAVEVLASEVSASTPVVLLELTHIIHLMIFPPHILASLGVPFCRPTVYIAVQSHLGDRLILVVPLFESSPQLTALPPVAVNLFATVLAGMRSPLTSKGATMKATMKAYTRVFKKIPSGLLNSSFYPLPLCEPTKRDVLFVRKSLVIIRGTVIFLK
jgi:hypothetical protein